MDPHIFPLIRIRIFSTDSRMEAEDGPREEGIPRNNTTRNRTACAGLDYACPLPGGPHFDPCGQPPVTPRYFQWKWCADMGFKFNLSQDRQGDSFVY